MSEQQQENGAKPIAHSAGMSCPCCAGPLSTPFYETGPVPVHSCLMLNHADEARDFFTDTVQLVFCEHCAFVTNANFDPRWSAYAPNYEDQQSYSPTFNSFAGQLASDLINRYDLSGKQVVEVGCSKGDFMRLLAEIGGMTCIGIDPSSLPGRIPPPRRGSLEFIREYYSKAHIALPADVIVCRHTLEHIANVGETLRLFFEHARQNPGCLLQIEVPDSTRIWREAAFEDIYYEHCSYFTPGSLARAVRDAGFAVVDIRREYDDQYLVLEATIDPNQDQVFPIEATPAEEIKEIIRFSGLVNGVISDWSEFVSSRHDAGSRVALWGSGSKCVAFLKTTGLEPSIQSIVDINPNRHGKFAPSLTQPIAAPEDLAALGVDLTIIMNPIYRTEIQTHLKSLGVDTPMIALGDPLHPAIQ